MNARSDEVLIEKLDVLNLPPLTEEEVQAEIDAARCERAQRR